jgi:hypothetical protein
MSERNSNSIYTRGLTDQQLSDGIDNLSPQKVRSMVAKHFPGGANVAPGVGLAEALRANGAAFEIEKVPTYHVTGTHDGCPVFDVVPNRVALRRSDDHHVTGTAGADYGIVQTLDALAAPALLVQSGSMALQSVQVIDGGARVRVAGLVGSTTLQAIGRPKVDTLAHMAIFEAGHTGRHATTGAGYTINVTCLNGMTSKTAAARFSIGHTSNAAARTREASAAFLAVSESTLAEAATFEALALTEFRLDDMRAFSEKLANEERGEASEDDSERKRLARERLIETWVHGFTNGTGCVGQSKWDCYNAITEDTTGVGALNPSEEIAARYAKAKDTAAKFAAAFDSQASGHYARRKDRALALLAS